MEVKNMKHINLTFTIQAFILHLVTLYAPYFNISFHLYVKAEVEFLLRLFKHRKPVWHAGE